MDIDALVQEKIEADADFQEKLLAIPEEEQEQFIEEKRKEVLSQEFTTLKQKADEADKAKELADNYKARAEKAEREKMPKQKENELSSTDLYALMNAKVPEEDISEVIDYARLKKVSISEALKASVVKTILSEKAEERETANATATGVQRRSAPQKNTDEAVFSEVYKGKLPDDDAGIARLAEAEMNRKIAERSRK